MKAAEKSRIDFKLFFPSDDVTHRISHLCDRSSTFYACIFHTKMLCTVFLWLRFREKSTFVKKNTGVKC